MYLFSNIFYKIFDSKLTSFNGFYFDRLLSWAGRGIEPVGVDYVLQKLGFSHARTTIPKWIQRGIMDPCDLMCAKLSTSLIEYMTAKSETTDDSNQDTIS